MRRLLDRGASVALPGLALAISAWVYRGVPRTYFFADDFACMVDIVNAGFLRFVLHIFGGHILIVRNAVFWALYETFGFDPRPYYWSALLTHLLNVWLVYGVGRRLTDGSRPLACLGAAVWGASPLALGTLGWYAVYGQQLVATVMLVVLDQMLRTPAAGPSRAQLLGWAIVLLAGMTCFGVGIAVAMAFPLVLVLLVPQTFARPRLRIALLAFPLVVAGAYFGFRRLYAIVSVLPAQEVVLDRTAMAHPGPILAMLWHLIAYGTTALLRGFRFVDAYPDMASHALVATTLAVVAAAAVAGGPAVRRRLAALAILCVASYALIAIGRSNVYLLFHIEPSAAARQPRYHYVGTIPVVLALCVALARLARPLAPVVLVVWLAFTGLTLHHATWFVDPRMATREWVAQGQATIDAAVEAGHPGDTVYVENADAPPAVMGPALGPKEFPGLAGLFAIMHPTDVVRGRTVRFIEPRPGLFFMFRDRAVNRRLADLIVNPNAVAQGAE